MKRLMLAVLFLITANALLSCAPVIRKDLVQQAESRLSFEQLRAEPSQYTGRLFLLGGQIVKSRMTKNGTLLEAIYIPVDRNGNLRDVKSAGGRYMSIYPPDKGYIDPEIYKGGRRITIAGEFTGIQTGRIDEYDYVYPVFRILDIYLWPEFEQYPYYTGYPPFYSPFWPGAFGYRGYFWHDPFWGPYPYGW